MEEIGNIHVVHNQYALEKAGRKRLRLHKGRYAELRDSQYGSRVSPEDAFIHTSKRPEYTAEQMADRYRPGDVFALFVGDGGFHDAINGIHRISAYPHLKEARFLLIDRGFASDGAKQLNPMRALRRPSTILDRNQTIDFAPLKWHMRYDSGQEDEYLANIYGTIGVSALVAHAISEEPNRVWAGDSWFKKAWITRNTASRAPMTAVEDPLTGRDKEVYDIGFANGSRMSGFSGAFPVELEEPAFFQYEVDNPDYLLAGVRLAMGRTPGSTMAGPYPLYLPHGGYVQLDGEAMRVPPALATISRHEETYTVFASRPQGETA